MFSKSLGLSGLVTLLLSISPLISATAIPNPLPLPLPESTTLTERALPGCPSVKVLPAKNQLFYGTLTRPEIATWEGGYPGFVKEYYSPNFTITDTTSTYPTWIKGKKRPALGTWAKTNKQFADGLQKHLPYFREIFDVQVVGGIASDAGQGAKCRETTVRATFSAKLKKNFGGKKKGFTFKFTYKHTLTVRFINGESWIDKVVMKQDWSNFFK